MARSALRRKTPSESRDTPLSSDARSIAHTLKSRRRSRNGETAKSASVSRAKLDLGNYLPYLINRVGAAFVANGRTGPGGSLPVNTDGGHLSHAYVPGMTHVLEGVRQIRGVRGTAQISEARVGVVSTFAGPDHATLVLTRDD